MSAVTSGNQSTGSIDSSTAPLLALPASLKAAESGFTVTYGGDNANPALQGPQLPSSISLTGTIQLIHDYSRLESDYSHSSYRNFGFKWKIVNSIMIIASVILIPPSVIFFSDSKLANYITAYIAGGVSLLIALKVLGLQRLPNPKEPSSQPSTVNLSLNV